MNLKYIEIDNFNDIYSYKYTEIININRGVVVFLIDLFGLPYKAVCLVTSDDLVFNSFQVSNSIKKQAESFSLEIDSIKGFKKAKKRAGLESNIYSGTGTYGKNFILLTLHDSYVKSFKDNLDQVLKLPNLVLKNQAEIVFYNKKSEEYKFLRAFNSLHGNVSTIEVYLNECIQNKNNTFVVKNPNLELGFLTAIINSLYPVNGELSPINCVGAYYLRYFDSPIFIYAVEVALEIITGDKTYYSDILDVEIDYKSELKDFISKSKRKYPFLFSKLKKEKT